MGRGPSLTEQEKGAILAYHDTGEHPASIATKINRSRHLVETFLKDPTKYGSAKRTGRKPSISPRQKRQLFHKASTTGESARNLNASLELPIGVRHTRRLLHDNEHLKWVSAHKSPVLSELNRQRRVTWATFYVTWTLINWNRVIFSDEKRFCLDGPDGFNYYWRDLRNDKSIVMSRRQGGGGIMVWGGFSSFGVTKLAMMKGKQKSEDYIGHLESCLLPYAEERMPLRWIFQQDNAPIHTSGTTKAWLQSNFINVMDWPAQSPDLNPIENIWGWMARKVYANRKQYRSLEEIEVAVKQAWRDIEKDFIDNLLSSMQNRAIEVLQKRGGHTHW